MIPPALGVDLRFLNGYMYLSPVGVTDPEEIEARVPEFAERAGYYFANWDRLYAAWMPKVRALIDELEAINFSPLPDREDMAVITEGRGTGSALDLFTTYHRLVDLLLKLWHYHFEFLNLGYVAYLDFFGCCKQLFPSIPDQAIAKMVAGIQVDLFQPDEEVKKLAQLAVELGLADRFSGSAPAAEVLDGLRGDPQGDKWLAAWEEAKQPWFNFSAGSGFYHSDKVWLEYLDIPLGFLRTYIAKVQRGETLERPMEAVIAERDRIVERVHRADRQRRGPGHVPRQAGAGPHRVPVRGEPQLLRRALGPLGHLAEDARPRPSAGVEAGFFADPDDVFLLSRHEVTEVLFDLYHGWAVGVPSRGPKYWPREMARRNGIMNALRQWSPPPALGVPPEVITEPFTVMLWGITSDSVRQWLGGAQADGGLSGFAASPGVAEGPARVIMSADGIGDLRDGEVLVAPLTAPSWAPVFGKIAATVTDVGGIMSHAAIVCREYGLPAVTGTAFGTKTIKTGQRLRVDGNAGTVTIID